MALDFVSSDNEVVRLLYAVEYFTGLPVSCKNAFGTKVDVELPDDLNAHQSDFCKVVKKDPAHFKLCRQFYCAENMVKATQSKEGASSLCCHAGAIQLVMPLYRK